MVERLIPLAHEAQSQSIWFVAMALEDAEHTVRAHHSDFCLASAERQVEFTTDFLIQRAACNGSPELIEAAVIVGTLAGRARAQLPA